MRGPGEHTYDCQQCGACCCNPDENRSERYIDYVEVTRRSALASHPRLLQRLTVVNASGERHMRLRGAEQRCVALEGTLGLRVACTIYALRPAGCRAVVPGSKECRRDRRERGIDFVK
ncbi:MAG: YkgJ family cysteine cluster protein [Myxococcales bacterium]|nr:YkgJ family cysteine cluster protein [Myxococcales bacterium]